MELCSYFRMKMPRNSSSVQHVPITSWQGWHWHATGTTNYRKRTEPLSGYYATAQKAGTPISYAC